MSTMRQLHRSRAAGRRGLRRAATQLEFAFILPIFLFLVTFSYDMGQVILTSGAMQDATFSAARAGAQVGGAGFDARTGTFVCPSAGSCAAGSTRRTFDRAATQIPFSSLTKVNSMTINTGARCRATGNDAHVALTTTYTVRLITPGLNALLSIIKGTNAGPDTDWQMTAKGVARCEIVR